MLKKKRFLIGGIIIFLAIGYLGYMSFGSSAAYYYEVSELLEQGDSIYSQNAQVNGRVAPGSLEQEPGGLTLRFTLNDINGGASLPVVYHGAVPDTFKVGNEVIVEGQYTDSGIFEANKILTKCASKYLPAA